jgi:hypothetical protein
MTIFREMIWLKLPQNKIMDNIFKKKEDKMIINRKRNLRKKILKIMKKMTITN